MPCYCVVSKSHQPPAVNNLLLMVGPTTQVPARFFAAVQVVCILWSYESQRIPLVGGCISQYNGIIVIESAHVWSYVTTAKPIVTEVPIKLRNAMSNH